MHFVENDTIKASVLLKNGGSL